MTIHLKFRMNVGLFIAAGAKNVPPPAATVRTNSQNENPSRDLRWPRMDKRTNPSITEVLLLTGSLKVAWRSL